MTRTMMFGILIASLWTNVSYGMGNNDKEIIFRPMTLTILDAETKLPLEGIVVNVVNITFYPRKLQFFGYVIEQHDEKTYHGYSYKTNSEGVVELPQFVYTVRRNIFLYEQNIVINLNLNEELYNLDENAKIFNGVIFYTQNDVKYVYRPRPDYKAGNILSKPFPMPKNLFSQSKETMPYITMAFNGHEIPDLTDKEAKLEPQSFFCGHEAFTFYLERFIETE